MSEDPRRRTSSDTLRSTRSENSPTLSRALPHRHSVNNRSPATVIALGGSRESLHCPSPDAATRSEARSLTEEGGGACTVIQVVGSPPRLEDGLEEAGLTAAPPAEVSRLLRTVQTTL